MAKLLKLRRGTTSQHSSFTGAEGECTVDTTKDTLVVHDGSTAAGRALLREDLNNLATGAITSTHLAANSVDSSELVDGGVDHSHLANDCIDGDNLQDNAVDSEHYTDGSIDHVHLAGDCIDGDNIQDDVVNSEHIAAGAVDLEHMSSQSVDEDNLYVSNAPTNGYVLTARSGNNGGMTWEQSSAGGATVISEAKGFEAPATVPSNWTIGSANNAMFPGPMTVASGATITVPANRTLTVV